MFLPPSSIVHVLCSAYWRVGLPDSADKSTCNISHSLTLKKSVVVYLKLKFNWISCNLKGSGIWEHRKKHPSYLMSIHIVAFTNVISLSVISLSLNCASVVF